MVKHALQPLQFRRTVWLIAAETIALTKVLTDCRNGVRLIGPEAMHVSPNRRYDVLRRY